MEEVKKYDEIIKKAGKFKFLGAQMVQTLPMGLAPPVYIWAKVRASGRHQEAKTIDTPTTLLPILQVQILQDKTTM